MVVPAFNEAESLPEVFADLRWLMDRLDGPCEVLVVDDGSGDDTYLLAAAEQASDPRFRALQLSRNFGHQVALTAGVTHARGAAVVTMDADRQHPVEVVLEMARLWRAGADVVYGVMTSRPSESALKRHSSDAFYRLLARVGDTPMPANAGDFRLLDRAVVDAFLQMPERSRYLRGMISWLGFTQVGVPYTCAPRHGGRSSYTLRRMLQLAFNAIVSFSTWPLRLGVVVGGGLASLALLFGLLTVVVKVTAGTVPGYATNVVLLSFLGGMQLMLLGAVGEYVGRIYQEVKGRPLYVLRTPGTGSPRPEPVRALARADVEHGPTGAHLELDSDVR